MEEEIKLHQHMRPDIFKTGLENFIKDVPSDYIMVEIGSFEGESTELFAQKVKHIIAVDPWDDSPSDLKKYGSMEIIKKGFDKRMSTYKNYSVLRMRSAEASRLIADNSIDMVYIDGSHFYDDVKQDIELWRHKVRCGGMISGHDITNYEVVAAINFIFGIKNVEHIYADSSWSITKKVPSSSSDFVMEQI